VVGYKKKLWGFWGGAGNLTFWKDADVGERWEVISEKKNWTMKQPYEDQRWQKVNVGLLELYSDDKNLVLIES
jgi:hypothetical protein